MSRKDLTTREPVNCAVDKELNKKLIQLSKDTKIHKYKLLIMKMMIKRGDIK